MRIQEAIEIQERQLAGRISALGDRRKEATALAIEALKRELSRRQKRHPVACTLLPGETLE